MTSIEDKEWVRAGAALGGFVTNMQSEQIPVQWEKVGKTYKEKRDVHRTRLASYASEGERLKAEAECGKTGSAKVGSSRLSDEATKILKGRG